MCCRWAADGRSRNSLLLFTFTFCEVCYLMVLHYLLAKVLILTAITAIHSDAFNSAGSTENYWLNQMGLGHNS